MFNSQTASKAVLFSQENSAENEIDMGDDAETALMHLHRICAASDRLHPRLIQFRPLACSGETEFFYSVEEVVAAIESGSVHSDQRCLPTMFASTNDFNSFLNELAVLYRRSVDRLNCRFDGTQTQIFGAIDGASPDQLQSWRQ